MNDEIAINIMNQLAIMNFLNVIQFAKNLDTGENKTNFLDNIFEHIIQNSEFSNLDDLKMSIK